MECPECLKNQNQTTLKPYQINFKEAVYLCPEELCTYPSATETFLTQQSLYNNDLNIENDSTDSDIETITKMYANRARQKLRKKTRIKTLNLSYADISSDDEETIQKAHNILTSNINKNRENIEEKIYKLLGCDSSNLGYVSSDSSDLNFSDLVLLPSENSDCNLRNPDSNTNIQENMKDSSQNAEIKPKMVSTLQKPLDPTNLPSDEGENISKIASPELNFPIKISISSTQSDEKYAISIDDASLLNLEELCREKVCLDDSEHNLKNIVSTGPKAHKKDTPKPQVDKKDSNEIEKAPNVSFEGVVPTKKPITKKFEILKIETLQNNWTQQVNKFNEQRRIMKLGTQNNSPHFKLTPKVRILETHKLHSIKLSKIDITSALLASGIKKDEKIVESSPNKVMKRRNQSARFASKFEGFKFGTKVLDKSVLSVHNPKKSVENLVKVSNSDNNKKTNEKLETAKVQSPPDVTSDFNLTNMKINESFSLDQCNIINLDELLNDIDLENSNLSQSSICKNLDDVDDWLKSLVN